MKKAILWTVLTCLALPLGAGEKSDCTANAHACLREMAAKLRERGWIGIEMDSADGHRTITEVVADSPAERSGLVAGDKLLAFNGVAHEEGEEAVYAEVKRSLVPGRKVTLTIERAGQKRDIEVVLEKIPEHLVAQWVGQHMLAAHAAETDGAADSEETPGR